MFHKRTFAWSNVKFSGSFPSQKECPKASEILWDNISKSKYILHVMPLQQVSISERTQTFKWYLIATQFRPSALVLVVCILNDLNKCQL